MPLFFFSPLSYCSSSTLKSKLERLWSVPSFKDIAMRTDLLDSNYLHKDGVLRVSSQSTYYPSFYEKIFRSTWLTFYLPLMPILLCTFDWLFFFSLVRTCTCNCFWKGYTLAFHLLQGTFLFVFMQSFLYIRNSADIFYTLTAAILWSKRNPCKVKNLPFDYAWYFSKICFF